jgi:ACR3 family arsenite transporter
LSVVGAGAWSIELKRIRAILEERQIAAYFAAIALGAMAGFLIPNPAVLEGGINPALALMLFVTFLQVPISEVRTALRNTRFLAALLVTNFMAMPIVTAVLIQFLPDDPMLRLAVLFVLLTPCIDYVVTFTHLGRGDARLLLAATPALLVLQMVLLPLYLRLLLDGETSGFVEPEPFITAFIWLIAVPLIVAGVIQAWAARAPTGSRVASALAVLPVPSTSLVLFLVVAAVMPRIGDASEAALRAAPIYVVYAVIAPIIGWLIARRFRLEADAARAVSFSAATRNSLVVLPLAFAIPGGSPVLPAVIVTQTMIELLSELVYVRWIPRLATTHTH